MVDENHSFRQCEGDPRSPRTDGKMVNKYVVCAAVIREVSVVNCEMFYVSVSSLHINVRIVISGAQHALNTHYFVSYGIAVTQRSEYLVHFDGPRSVMGHKQVPV